MKGKDMNFERLIALTRNDKNEDEFQFLSEKLEMNGIGKALAEKKKKEEELKVEEAAEYILQLGKVVHAHLIASRDRVRGYRTAEARELKFMSQMEMLFDYSVSTMDFTTIVLVVHLMNQGSVKTCQTSLDDGVRDIPEDFKKEFAEKRKAKAKKK